MEDSYLYYPGCTLKTKAKDYESSAMKVMEELGRPLVEMDDWYCCGAMQSLTEDDIMHQIAPIRTMCCAQEQGEEKVVTLCDMCYNVLKQANERMKENEDDLETMNDFLDEDPDYEGEVEVHHLLEILLEMKDEIEDAVTNSLDDLNIAPYYGCMLLRPDNVAIDETEDPEMMEEILGSLGAEVIENPKRTECCGSYHTVNRSDIVEKRVEDIVSYAVNEGADAIVLSCPLCQFNLDFHQRATEFELPVFYITELIALALGLDIEMENHKIDPISLLEEKGIKE
ncbi:MAG: CoB--CoM heterodisulfide reductase iron-sulfur subunit B family protein [Candidatus Thermoplasmatota archaeon]|nr:CoB--CoM heterodisulfide reductase iron-sulfur subunit B family protein [Candidatus Thermoplasmatota archaeon]